MMLKLTNHKAMYRIHLPEKEKSYFFKIVTASRTIIGSKMTEFIQEKIIELRLKEDASDHFIFQYNLHDHKMRGTSIIHQWIDDMEELQSEIMFATDKYGSLVDILNLPQIQKKWDLIKKTIKQKYPTGSDLMISETTRLLKDKTQFLESFTGYSSWRFFFQTWFAELNEKSTNELFLKNYFGSIDLPLIISSKIEDNTVKNTGILDAKKFDRKAFARMLKDLTDIYNIDATLSVDMEEKYKFGEKHFMENAEMFIETAVNEWYKVTNAHQLTQLTLDEAEYLKQENLKLKNLEKRTFVIE